MSGLSTELARRAARADPRLSDIRSSALESCRRQRGLVRGRARIPAGRWLHIVGRRISGSRPLELFCQTPPAADRSRPGHLDNRPHLRVIDAPTILCGHSVVSHRQTPSVTTADAAPQREGVTFKVHGICVRDVCLTVAQTQAVRSGP
jgi:hypothetical protein